MTLKVEPVSSHAIFGEYLLPLPEYAEFRKVGHSSSRFNLKHLPKHRAQKCCLDVISAAADGALSEAYKSVERHGAGIAVDRGRHLLGV